MSCFHCKKAKAIILRPKNKDKVCKECFFYLFESEVHEYAKTLFIRGENVGIAVSGGKDSTVLCHIIYTLNKKYNYGINLFLLSVDEGIKGYRDYSLEIVEENRKDYNLDLDICSFKEIVGYTMDDIVIKIGHKNNCTVCGVLRRTGLEKAAKRQKISKILLGHNADDMAETVLLNLIRGDYKRLITNKNSKGEIKRLHPLKYSYQKEIVLYAFHKKLKYFSVECTHALESHRGYVRELLRTIERYIPGMIINIIKTSEQLTVCTEKKSYFCINCNKETLSKNRTCQLCSLKIFLEEKNI